jgi:hypothetical protein
MCETSPSRSRRGASDLFLLNTTRSPSSHSSFVVTVIVDNCIRVINIDP